MPNRTSTQITATRNDTTDNGNSEGGMLRLRRGQIQTAAAETAGDIHRFLRVPSNAVIADVLFTTPAATSGNANIGVYQPVENGGAAISASFFAAALSVGAALNRSTQVAGAGGAYTQGLRAQPLWQALGLAADPGREFDIALTVSTNYVGASTTVPQTLEVAYTI